MSQKRKTADLAAHRASIIANPTRVRILFFLHARKGAYVGEVVEELGLSQSAVSHQLGLLAEEGVVIFKKEGRDVWYQLSRKPHARRLLKALRSL